MTTNPAITELQQWEAPVRHLEAAPEPRSVQTVFLPNG